MHLRYTNDVLIQSQNTNLDLIESLTNNLACIFESYQPDLHELKLKVDQEAANKEPDPNRDVIKIRPILSKPESKSKTTKVLSLFKNVTELNERM